MLILANNSKNRPNENKIEDFNKRLKNKKESLSESLNDIPGKGNKAKNDTKNNKKSNANESDKDLLKKIVLLIIIRDKRRILHLNKPGRILVGIDKRSGLGFPVLGIPKSKHSEIRNIKRSKSFFNQILFDKSLVAGIGIQRGSRIFRFNNRIPSAPARTEFIRTLIEFGYLRMGIDGFPKPGKSTKPENRTEKDIPSGILGSRILAISILLIEFASIPNPWSTDLTHIPIGPKFSFDRNHLGKINKTGIKGGNPVIVGLNRWIHQSIILKFRSRHKSLIGIIEMGFTSPPPITIVIDGNGLRLDNDIMVKTGIPVEILGRELILVAVPFIKALEESIRRPKNLIALGILPIDKTGSHVDSKGIGLPNKTNVLILAVPSGRKVILIELSAGFGSPVGNLQSGYIINGLGKIEGNIVLLNQTLGSNITVDKIPPFDHSAAGVSSVGCVIEGIGNHLLIYGNGILRNPVEFMIASTVLPVESDRENKVEIVSIGRAVKPIDIQVIILRNIKVEINHPVLEQVLIHILRRKSKSVGIVALTYLGSLDEVGEIPALILGINQNMVVELIKVMNRFGSVNIKGTDCLAGIGKISPRSNGKNLIAFPELDPGEVIIPEHPGKLVGNGSLAIIGIITILHGIPFPGKIRSLGSLENPTTGFCSHGERIPIDKGKRKQRSKQIQFHRFSFSINSGHPFPPGRTAGKLII
jgi:hypothetical protein